MESARLRKNQKQTLSFRSHKNLSFKAFLCLRKEREGERLEALEKAFCSRQTIKSFAIHKDSIQMTGVHISDLDGAQTPAH